MGKVDNYTVDGARNVFASRDAASRAAAAAALARWRGTYAAAWPDGERIAFLRVKVGARGHVRVTGTQADGTRLSASAQLTVGAQDGAVAAGWTNRRGSGAVLLWLGGDGSVDCTSLRGGAAVVAASTSVALAPTARLRIDAAALAAAISGFREDLTFPDGPGGNPARLRLRLRKDGTFSGSFRAYAVRGRRVRSVSVTLRGVVLDGAGFGVARIPGVGSLPIAIR